MTAIDDPTLPLPRLLCLHGGGVNAEVFRMQSRAIIAALKPHFRLVFADGPFLCNAGPGILPVYADHGPFRRWLRWLDNHLAIDSDAATDEIWFQLRDAMEQDDRAGATGEWVGLLGFSQGAKLAASLLYDRQVREGVKQRTGGSGNAQNEKELEEPMSPMPDWRFAVLLAGRAPLVSLCDASKENKALVRAGDVSEGFDFLDTGDDGHVLKLPTVHVHGLQDPGLHLHRRLLNHYCEPTSSTLVEWDGTHRVPIKSSDVQKVTKAILDVAHAAGVVASV